MNFLNQKRMVSDGNCPLCAGLRAWGEQNGFVGPEDVRFYHELPEEEAARVDAERFRREVALIDLGGGETLYGPDALEALFRSKWGWKSRLVFGIPGMRPFFRFLYETLAMNRYLVVAPQPGRIRCSCEPERSTRVRLQFAGVLVIWAVLISGLAGAAAGPWLGLSAGAGAAWLIAGAGLGWLLLMGMVRVRLGAAAWEFMEHMNVVMAGGVVPLTPAAAFLGLHTVLLPYSPLPYAVHSVLSGMVAGWAVWRSFTGMAQQIHLRRAHLNLAPAWERTWALSLWASLAGMTALFFL